MMRKIIFYSLLVCGLLSVVVAFLDHKGIIEEGWLVRNFQPGKELLDKEGFDPPVMMPGGNGYSRVKVTTHHMIGAVVFNVENQDNIYIGLCADNVPGKVIGFVALQFEGPEVKEEWIQLFEDHANQVGGNHVCIMNHDVYKKTTTVTFGVGTNSFVSTQKDFESEVKGQKDE